MKTCKDCKFHEPHGFCGKMGMDKKKIVYDGQTVLANYLFQRNEDNEYIAFITPDDFSCKFHEDIGNDMMTIDNMRFTLRMKGITIRFYTDPQVVDLYNSLFHPEKFTLGIDRNGNHISNDLTEQE
jgi:hypothetical protein